MNLFPNFNNYELYFLIYIVLINSITFMVYGADKNRARNKQWRIPELTLILLCLIGGAIGGLISMVIYKHKLSKKRFYIGVPLIIIINKTLELIIFNYIK